MSFDRYNALKERCSSCKAVGAEPEDCEVCATRDAIREYEAREEEPAYINVPVFSEEAGETGEHEIIGWRKEYV